MIRKEREERDEKEEREVTKSHTQYLRACVRDLMQLMNKIEGRRDGCLLQRDIVQIYIKAYNMT